MTIDEFQKADLRVVTITAVERVEGSEKLLKLQLDTGALDVPEDVPPSKAHGTRQILSGIAKYYTPESLVGKQVVIIANLEPRMMMGMESKGMLLAAHGEQGEAVILAVEKSVPPGSKIS